ncbi:MULTISPECIES: hypothetical protein [Streptacidiphilus]|uniref:Uncharacterized protein n=1 Tax=Streptacidiphilus cavernicola TaxID=3342716 RepID=A0ABV6UPA5_9ACTN|nr:hypothetical protein [Streptacidiphilus jeojiense]
MKKTIIAVVGSMLALALVVQGTPSLADSTRTQARATTGGNLGAEQMSLWENLPPAEWEQALEEDCVEHGTRHCEMSKSQVDAVLPDIKNLTAALDQEIRDDPSLVAALHPTKPAPQTRGVATVWSQVTTKIAERSKNAAVHALGATKYADAIGGFAEKVATANTVHDGLTDKTAEDVAKTVVGALPGLGDAFSLASAVSSGDLESGIVAVVSLAGTMVATVCPPAGVVIAVAALVYTVAKKIWGWLCGRTRDWRLDPPGNPEDLFKEGADLAWDARTGLVNGRQGESRNFAVLLSQFTPGNDHGEPVRWAHAKLLMDSNWSKAAAAGKVPKPYTVTNINLYGLQGIHDEVVFKSVQDGVERKADCRIDQPKDVWTAGISALCTLPPSEQFTISQGHPAVVMIDYDYVMSSKRDHNTASYPWYCTQSTVPCVPEKSAEFKSEVWVERGKERFHLPVDLGYGFVEDYPGDVVKHID